ncbi:uncharacterized protein ISCGN_024003 [Ixodes scapularis]
MSVQSFESQVLKLLLEQRQQLRELSQQNTALKETQEELCLRLAQLEGQLPRRTEPAGEAIQLPLFSLEDFQAAEEVLQDGASRKALRARFVLMGGTSVKDAVRCIMERTLKKEVQAHFTFVGRQGKQPFKGTKLFSVIKAAVQKKTKAADTEVEAAIRVYLYGVKDREGGRRSRFLEAVDAAASRRIAALSEAPASNNAVASGEAAASFDVVDLFEVAASGGWSDEDF